MKNNPSTVKSLFASLVVISAISLTGCYDPTGPTPEARKTKETKLWTNEQIDEIAEVSYLHIDASEPVNQPAAPAACNKIGFLRIRSKNGPENAEQADAAFLMVPGVLEGASAFEFIGRQMVYLAEKEHNRHIEVWAMDRRSNCLEDLTGIALAKQEPSLDTATDIIANYYYKHQPINGKYFEGFKRSSQLRFLSEFGMRQATLDMHDILRYMMPTPGISKKKAFVGGHSLGGVHTSVFLAWDFDGDPNTTDDAGYKLVAGAFGLETEVRPLTGKNFFSDSALPAELASQLKLTATDSDSGYKQQLKALRLGLIPRNVDIPGVFTSEIIALPEFLGIAAAKDPDAESVLLSKVPLSPAVKGITKLLHSRQLTTIGQKPLLADFRYTNKAMVGIFFDDNFEPLSFLQAGLGFLDGGPIVEKWAGYSATMKYYIAANAGPDLDHLHQGPLYGWADRDEIGDLSDPDFMDTTGKVRFTYLENEPADMNDFIHALSATPTNLTEWYFPLRILLDSNIITKDFAPNYGINTYHREGVTHIDSFVVNGSQGIKPYHSELTPVPRQTRTVAPGYTHMDPMFEAVNSPTQHSYVIRPLLEFALARTEQ